MNESETPAPLSQVDRPALPQCVCYSCGALCELRQQKCWMCGSSLQSGDPYATNLPQPPKLTQPAPSTFGSIFMVLLLVCLGLAVMIGIGMAMQDPGALVGYLILIGPAFTITGVRALRQVSETGQVQTGKLLLGFVVSIMVTVLVLTALAVAAIVLLITTCFSLSSGS